MAKLKLTYGPEGGSPREWIIDLDNPAWDLRFATEKATGWPWEPFAEKLDQGSAIAMQALIWTLRKRDEPRLQIDAVQPMVSEIEIEVECPDCAQWVTDPAHDCGPTDAPAHEDAGGESSPGEA